MNTYPTRYLMHQDLDPARPAAEKLAVALAKHATVRGVPAEWCACSPLDKAALGRVDGLVIEARALYHPGVFAVGVMRRDA